LGDAAVQGIMDRGVSETAEWKEFKELEQLGIDASASKQGQRDFFTRVTTRLVTGSMRVLGVVAGREPAPVKKFFLVFPRSYLRRFEWVVAIGRQVIALLLRQ
jgi:hypothetical protein